MGRVSVTALIIATLALAGCAATDPAAPLSSQAPASQDTAAAQKTESDSVSGNENPLAEQNSQEFRIRNASTKELVGMEEPEVAALLGYPRYVREESIARVWQYAAGDCVLDLFLYPDLDAETVYQVIHVEARHRRIVTPVSLKMCFGGVVQDHTSGKAPEGLALLAEE